MWNIASRLSHDKRSTGVVGDDGTAGSARRPPAGCVMPRYNEDRARGGREAAQPGPFGSSRPLDHDAAPLVAGMNGLLGCRAVHVRVGDGFDTKSHTSRTIDGVDRETMALAREVVAMSTAEPFSVSGYTMAWKRACKRLARAGCKRPPRSVGN